MASKDSAAQMAAANAMLAEMVAEKAAEDEAAFNDPCSEEEAKAEAAYYKKLYRGKPLQRVVAGSNLFHAGNRKNCSKVQPQVLAGIVKYGLGSLNESKSLLKLF